MTAPFYSIFLLSHSIFLYSNLQLTSIDPALVAYFIKNAGKSTTKGAEANALWQATPEFSVNGGVAYNRGKFTDFHNAQCYSLINPGTPAMVIPPCMAITINGRTTVTYDRTGQDLPRAPRWTLSGGFNYERPIGNGLKAAIGGDAVRTSSYLTSETGDPNTRMPSHWRLNAHASIAAQDDKWELAFYGRNLTNECIFVISNDKVLSSPGNSTAYGVRPRELGLQATVKF